MRGSGVNGRVTIEMPMLRVAARGRSCRCAAAALGLAVLLTAPALGLLALLPQPAVAQARARVAVLPMLVHAQEGRDYLREGLTDMLASRLGQSPEVAVVVVDDPAQATTRAEAARESARAVSAQYVVFGSFTRFGEGASLDVRCLRTDGADDANPRSIFIQSGTLGGIIPNLDGLADKIVRHVVDPLPPPEPVVAEEAPPALAPGGVGAVSDPVADAAFEIEVLRERVDRLEAELYSRNGGRPLGPPGLTPGEVATPEVDPLASAEPKTDVR